MKIIYFLLYFVNCSPIITNVNIPSCKNCKYYNPSHYNDFTSLNKCNKFGEKNIITDEITYNYADTCRNDESKCGKDGKYFEKESNVNLKIIKYKIINDLPNILLVSSLVLMSIITLFYPK